MANSAATSTTALYASLSKIQDPHLRHLLKLLLDQTGNLNGQAPSIGKVTQPLDQHMDANSKKVQNLADPTAKQDAATKAYVDKQIAQIAAAFSAPKP